MPDQLFVNKKVRAISDDNLVNLLLLSAFG